MSNIIRIKRRSALGAAGAPSSLYNAELAYNEKDNTLYYGFGDNGQGIATSIIPIGGIGALDDFLVAGKNIRFGYDAGTGKLTINVSDDLTGLTSLEVGNLRLDSNTISSIADTVDSGKILLNPAGSGYVQIVGTNGLVIPVGTTLERAPNVEGAIRLNSTIGQFEGYSNGNWASLGGVRSVDGLTYISAELTPGGSDDTLRFYTGDVAGTGSDLPVTITSSTLQVYATTHASVTTSGEPPTTSYAGALIVDGGVLIKDNLIVLGDFEVAGAVTYTDGVVFEDFVTLNGPVYSDLDTFELLNADSTGLGTGPTTVNAFLDATTVSIGAATGTTTVNNDLQVGGNDILSSNGSIGITLVPLGTAPNLSTDVEVPYNLHVLGTTDLDGAVEIGNSGAPTTLTVYGTTVDIDATTTNTLSTSGNSASATNVIIDAANSSSGEASVDISAKTDITLTAPSIVTTASDTEFNVDTLTIAHTSGQTSSTAVDIYGNVVIQSGGGTSSLTVDNIVIDGNTISSTDISNVLIIDPAPLEGEASAIEISTTGTVGTITGTGPWNAVITGMTSTLGLAVGSAITATNGTGSLGAGGTYVVDQIISSTSVSFIATGGTTPVAGSITGVTEINEQGLVIIKGNLQVDGVTTTVNSTTVTIEDPVFTLGGEGTPTISDPYDRGIEFKWIDDTATPSLGFFGWDRSAQEFVFIDHAATPTANNFVPDTGKTYSDIRIGSAALVDATVSTDVDEGALIVAGGAGIGGQLNVGGAVNLFKGNTDSIQLNAGLYSSANTGTIVVTGGVNIGLSLYVDNHVVGSPPADGVYASKIENFLIDGGTF